MAVIDTKLVLACNVGKDGKGKDIIKKMRYSDINLMATSEELHEVAQAMGALTVGLDGVFKEDKSILTK